MQIRAIRSDHERINKSRSERIIEPEEMRGMIISDCSIIILNKQTKNRAGKSGARISEMREEKRALQRYKSREIGVKHIYKSGEERAVQSYKRK